MRVIPVPRWVADANPLAVTKVFGPPDGDPTGDIRPVEILVDPTESGICMRAFAIAEEGDCERLSNGGVVELGMYGEHLHPFFVDVHPAPAPTLTPEDTPTRGALSAPAENCIHVERWESFALEAINLEHGIAQMAVSVTFVGRLNKASEQRTFTTLMSARDARRFLDDLDHTVTFAETEEERRT